MTRSCGGAREYGVREVRDPAIESRYGIGTYGFALCDRNGNWWRIEDADGPFGTTTLPADDSTSIVPAGPVSYVTLEVRDVDTTFAFYRDVLGLDAVLRDGAIHYAGYRDESAAYSGHGGCQPDCRAG